MKKSDMIWILVSEIGADNAEGRDAVFDIIRCAAYEHIQRQRDDVIEQLIWLYEVPAAGAA